MWKIISYKVQCFVLILQKRQISWVKVEVIWTSKINNNFKNRHFFPFSFTNSWKKYKSTIRLTLYWFFFNGLLLFKKLIMFSKIFFANIQLAKRYFQRWNQAFLSKEIWLLLNHGLHKVFWYLEYIKTYSLPSFFSDRQNCPWQGRRTSDVLRWTSLGGFWFQLFLSSLCLSHAL